MVKLYDFELSAECYSLRLMLGILGIAYEMVAIDIYPGTDNDVEWFRALSPAGTLPVLLDGQPIVGVEAGLRWLAGDGAWCPAGAEDEIAQWLGFGRAMAESAGVARTGVAFGWDADLPVAQAAAHKLLRQLDEHLWFGERQGQDWLIEGTHPTIAEVAVFPHVVLSEEGGVSRQDYPAIRRWLDRVRRIPGFVVMSGVFPAAPAFTR